jgi:hypothetical protein
MTMSRSATETKAWRPRRGEARAVSPVGTPAVEQPSVSPVGAPAVEHPAVGTPAVERPAVGEATSWTAHPALLASLLAALLVAASAGCREGGATRSKEAAASPVAASGKRRLHLPPHREHDTLAEAIAELVPPRTRLLGLGELHARVDRPNAPSTLVRFTEELLPALPARTSDLILETWAVDGRCGKIAAAATASLQAATRRPESTQSELGILAGRSRGRGLRSHSMRVTCDDYKAMAAGGDDAIVHMLDLTTSELTRLAVTYLRRAAANAPVASVIAEPPLIVIYGGALHNDRFPTAGLASWSYAPSVEADSERTYVEVDLITPELAEDDPALASEPWAPLLGVSSHVVTYQRGERSYVVVLPRAKEPHTSMQ